MASVDANHGVGGKPFTTASGLTPVKEANMIERALRRGWRPDWTAEERREVIESMLEGLRTAQDMRGKVAAARVLATLERNVIADERNQIQEHGQELGAATDRLRAALGSPEARKALADLASTRVAAEVTSPETTQPANAAELAARRVEAR